MNKQSFVIVLGAVLVVVVILLFVGIFSTAINPPEIAPNYLDCTVNPNRTECLPSVSCTDSPEAWAKCYPGEKG